MENQSLKKPSHFRKFVYLALIIISFLVGKSFGDPNRTLTYGDTGYPKNCRAIIAENLDAWSYNYYTAEEVLESIARNCG
jgi:hypothetical protein